MTEKQQLLVEALKPLDTEQMAQFMWMEVVRATPYFSTNFSDIIVLNNNGYLSLLFLSIETCKLICTSNRFNNNIIRADLVNALKNAINDSDLMSIRLHDLAMAVSQTLIVILDYIAGFIKIEYHDPNLYIFSDKLPRFPSREKYEEFERILLEDADLLFRNRNNELNNDTNWYGDVWTKWLEALRKLGGEYWADWYERLFKNRFQVIDENELLRHVSLPKELWDKDLGVSAQWFMKIAQHGAKHLNEARLILLGEKGAGKTSLARRLIYPKAQMPTKEESTSGVDVTSVKLSVMATGIPEERDANVHIWDFAGHAITHAVHRFFLSERCLYIIVYDGRTEGRNRLEYWLDHVRNYGGKSRVIIFVNLQDEFSPDISENYFENRYADHQCMFVRFSIKDDLEKLQCFREMLAEIIADDPAWDQKIPMDYYLIKEQLEKVFSRHVNHIKRVEFDQLAACVAEVERDNLLKSLTCLGVCLWYPDIKEIDLLVLNPEWITRGIYRIVNWLKDSERPNATVALSEFNEVFEEMRRDYPHDKHNFLYQLMQKYELAYKKPYCEEIVVPQCLPEDCPAKADLPDFQMESLYAEITANKSGDERPRLTFPPDVLPRFIVRRSDELAGTLIWRYGATLKKGSVTAFIEQDDFLIRIRVKGKERSDYYAELRDTLMAVLSSYPSFAADKPEINCRIVSIDGNYREMISENRLINIAQHMNNENKASYYDPAIKMEYTLDYIMMYIEKIDELNRRMARVENMAKEVKNPINVNGQAFFGNEGTIYAPQYNGVNLGELAQLIETLKKAIPLDASKDDLEKINESIAAIEDELHKPKPKKGFLNTLLTGLKAIKGTAEFAAAVVAIIQFVQGLTI